MKCPSFKDFDFSVLQQEEFKESDVREDIISPILKALSYKSYGRNKMIREKRVTHSQVKTGSTKKNLVNYLDYLMQVDDKYTFVLEAKGPKEDIKAGENVEQAYFYAIHPEIRVNYYALCNGKEFILFHISEQKAVLYFQVSEIENYWEEMKAYLSPDAFVQAEILADKKDIHKTPAKKDYDNIQLPKPIKPRKQAAKRHFGVHGYFTRQAWNVVQHYVKHFTKKGDLVLDPFGGGGATLIEALMTDREAIHIDLNPLSVFMTEALIQPVDMTAMQKAFERIKKNFEKNCPQTEEEFDEALEKYYYPKGIKLAKGADVDEVEDLFTKKQLAQLAYLRQLIIRIRNKAIKKSLFLAFSSSVNKFNRTFHYTQSKGGGGGDSSAFRYYRYRIAPKPPSLDLMQIFETKYKRLVGAKKEMEVCINEKTIKNAEIIKGDATDLANIGNETIDYIYTDPPYGKKIAYLDLSAMWNAWLNLKVTPNDFEKEAIEGGSLNKSADEYCDLIRKSIEEMYRVLKFGRWMSFVFSHKDPKYWHLIVETAEKVGFEYAGVVKQSNGQSSFKKRQHPFSVLSGQLIINFRKVKTPQSIQKAKLGIEIYDIIIETIESTIAEHNGATLEQINDSLITAGLELGFLDILSKEYKDLTPILLDKFDYDTFEETFHIKKNKKFRTTIPLDLRIRYFLLSYLRRKTREKSLPTTDELILDIMPLLKNGITPENQTILKVLEGIAEQIDGKRWQIKQNGQGKLHL